MRVKKAIKLLEETGLDCMDEEATQEALWMAIDALKEKEERIRCKDCKHFEYDHVEKVDGIPLIVGHEICKRWGEGCKTSENGWCFLAERKEK